jgi:hypothetical protein
MFVKTLQIIKSLCNVVLVTLAAATQVAGCNSSWVNGSEGFTNVQLTGSVSQLISKIGDGPAAAVSAARASLNEVLNNRMCG